MLIQNRRLPIYVLLDCSESMVGDPLKGVNQGLQQLCLDLKLDPLAIETAWVSVITFARAARQVCPLTEVLSFLPPTLTVGPGTSLGAALDLLGQCIDHEVRVTTPTQKGDWKPIVFLLTDGQPTDNWREALARFQARTARRLADFVALGVGVDVDARVLHELAPNVVLMPDITSRGFQKFFRMVSASVRTASASPTGGSKGLDIAGKIGEGLIMAGKTFGATAPGPASQIILAVRCSVDGGGYLMRYRQAEGERYQAEAQAYRVGSDYFAEAGAAPSGQEVDAGKLDGAPACPYCGRVGWKLARGKGLVCNDKVVSESRRAQVMFVLDVTGSMHEEIEGVKENINQLVDYIQSEGLSIEVGLIAFRDLEEAEPPEVLQFRGRAFTADVAAFKAKVSELVADGGGRYAGESSYDAIVLACRQAFDDSATRILILVTDEPPKLPDGPVRSERDVTKALTDAHIDQLHFVIPHVLEEIYAPLHRAAGGETFPLVEGGRGGVAFRKVLMDIGKSITLTTRAG